ncbi:MAG TPA: hypothetical protein VL172_15960, partial [Kofleriaceae bacterium]|nr:hypothetical protein [Kofleriaceae bacterium]
MRTWILTVMAVCALTGCGKKKENGDDQGKEGPAPTVPAVPPPPAAADAAAAAPPAPKVVMPSDVSADKPLSVAELDAIMKQWKDGTEVAVTGYATFFIGEDGELGTSIKLAAQPGQKEDKAILECDLVDAAKGKKVDNKTLLTFTGKVAGRWGNNWELMLLKDCALADKAPAAAKPVADLVAAYMGWFG